MNYSGTVVSSTTSTVSKTTTTAAPTSTITSTATPPASTVTGSTTTVTTTTTTTIVRTFATSELFGFFFDSGGIKGEFALSNGCCSHSDCPFISTVDPAQATPYFVATSSKTDRYYALNLVTDNPRAINNDQRNGFASGLLYTSGRFDKGKDFTAVVDLTTFEVLLVKTSTGLTSNQDQIFCNLSSPGVAQAGCSAANHPTYYAPYICTDSKLYLGPPDSPTLTTECQAIEVLGYAYS